MGSLLETLSKDKPLYALTIGEFETLMSELMPASPIVDAPVKEPTKFVDINGASAITSKSPNALRVQISLGNLLSIKKGSRHYFEREYLERWIKGEM